MKRVCIELINFYNAKAFQKAVVLLIDFYQRYLSFDTGALRVLAPGGACKYYPRCSQYTKEQIEELGVIKGSWLGLKRILSCR